MHPKKDNPLTNSTASASSILGLPRKWFFYADLEANLVKMSHFQWIFNVSEICNSKFNQEITRSTKDQSTKHSTSSVSVLFDLPGKWIFCADSGTKYPQKNLFLPLPKEGGRGDGTNSGIKKNLKPAIPQRIAAFIEITPGKNA